LANWDVFHGDRLELERGLTTSAIRDALAQGVLRDDDLVRPAGTTVAWARLADMPELLEPAEAPPQPDLHVPAPAARSPAPFNPPSSSVVNRTDFEVQAEEDELSSATQPAQDLTLQSRDWFDSQEDADDVTFPVILDDPAKSNQVLGGSKTPDVPSLAAPDWSLDDDDDDDLEEEDADFDGRPELVDDGAADDLEILEDETDAGTPVQFALVDDPSKSDDSSQLALPVVSSSEWNTVGALAEVPEDEEFSLSRSGPMTVEELDLAPMVDVAFQLVLFFMVAAQTILYKTLEIPKPSAEQAPSAVAQGRSRTLDELKEDYILLEIDGSGVMKLDREPIAANMETLVERLRSARETTHRKAMLLSAEYATSHRNAVLAYDAANEIGLGIVIAKPASPQGPAPRLLPAQPGAPAAAPPNAPAAPVPN
jgi:biopolymer transport protein ExbD